MLSLTTRGRVSGPTPASAPRAAALALAPPSRPASDGTIGAMVSEFIAQAKPVVTQEMLPVLASDTALQKTVGAAAGAAIAPHLAGPAWLGAAALTAIAVGVVVVATK
jgi:hypothetical protein